MPPRVEVGKLIDPVENIGDELAKIEPRRHYAPTVDEREMTAAERACAAAPSVDDIELDV